MLSLFSSLFLSAALAFCSPVNYPISLAGNFGEPRPNHFHGGIDVRTGQVEGKPVFSVADGYVSRITVGLGGFGNAIYVNHPGGKTSVYCHLKKFVPQLAAIVHKWQYQNQTCFADVKFKPTDFPVSKGQLIAVSGNTGASRAPHLHLEFHDTKTWSYLEPLQYLKDFVKDTTQPIAHSFMAYPVEGEGVFCGSCNKQSYGFSSTSLSRKFTAWGNVGFGIWANDYMEGSFGILGIRNTRLTVDGKIVFESDVDSIPDFCNRMVNSWGDYEHYCRTNVWYMKSFIEPGNHLPILYAESNYGVVTFDKERDYKVVYTITDVFGNSRDYSFVVRGVKQIIPQKKIPDFMNLVKYDRVNSFQRPGVSLFLPKGVLPGDVELRPTVKFQPGNYSDEWSFYGKSYPLFSWVNLSIKLNKPVKDNNKLYIISHFGIDRYMGGDFHDGWVTARVRELGAKYEIAYDDVPPVLTMANSSGRFIRVSASDLGSGLKSIKGYVDGKFVLFEYQEKAHIYICDLGASPVAKTGNLHDIKLIAVDNLDNKKILTAHFNY